MAVSADTAVRDYLTSLRDPSALRDEGSVAAIEKKLDSTEDQLERLKLRQQLIEADTPALDRYEDDFVTHAKAWADKANVTEKAFLAEGVPAQTLRKAGFRNLPTERGKGTTRTGSPRRRVSADQVRASIPSGTFTVRDVEDASGASSAVVRRIISEEVAVGNVADQGPDQDHQGPGRAPTLYKH